MVGKLIESTEHDSQTTLKHYKVCKFVLENSIQYFVLHFKVLLLQDVIQIDPKNEEGHYCLGKYYDRLLTLVENNPPHYGC